jgi:hypothetical protein
MLAQLAFPDYINCLTWQRLLIGEQFKQAATSLHNFEMSVFTENYLKDFLFKDPIFEQFSSKPLGRLKLDSHHVPAINSYVLGVDHHLLFLSLFLSVLNAFNDTFDLRDTLQSLFKVDRL